MKKTLRPFILIALLSMCCLMSCSNYGKKVKVSGTKGEVFYKGDGVTEADATKVGEFLKETGFLGKDKPASVQVSKEDDKFIVRFVYDKAYFDTTSGLEAIFKKYAVSMSKELFVGKKVDIALADKYFKDYKTIPYEEEMAPPTEPPNAKELNKSDFDHDTRGDVTFFWKGISDDESKTIADYITKNGSFAGGHSEIYITKDGDRYILSFPVKPEYRNDEGTINEIKKVSGEIKENLFPNTPYTFQMTDELLNAVKSFDY